jgi:hypothetical protein
MDIFKEREKWLEEGRKRWRELTKDWPEEDREWAEKFWMSAGMPWG